MDQTKVWKEEAVTRAVEEAKASQNNLFQMMNQVQADMRKLQSTVEEFMPLAQKKIDEAKEDTFQRLR